MTAQPYRGQNARSPLAIPARGWWDILLRVKDQITADHVSVVSAGVAFFGLLAIFPAVTALISIAGYVLDPSDVTQELEAITALLPEQAATILRDQVLQVTGGGEAATGLAAIFGLLLALYGSMKGVLTLMDGMNVAYDEREKRGFIALYASAAVMTLCLIAGVLGAVGVMILWPAVVGFLGLPEATRNLIDWLQWPILAVLAIVGLAALYRFGPSRSAPKWRWVWPGVLLSMVLWLAGTLGFAFYVKNFASYNETYGALGGVIVLLTWLWLSAFIVLAGAELNAEIEHQTRIDTTVGGPQPMGERGAVKADRRPPGLPAYSPGEDGASEEEAPRGRLYPLIGAMTVWGVGRVLGHRRRRSVGLTDLEEQGRPSGEGAAHPALSDRDR